jgi:dTDP-4-amino-4,6-dideoxygalactose transaminase
MSDYISFAQPSFDHHEIEAVTRVVASGWVSTGPEAQAFETEFAQYVGTSHAVALNSCTAALHLGLMALGVRVGDEVVVPAVTFTATAAAVVHAGGTPVFADVDPCTLNITPETAAAAITARTRAIVVVHFAGRMCDMRALRALADERGVTLVEDAAHALPASRDGVRVGELGDVSAYSFFATKTITSAEGGMLCAHDAEIEHWVRVLSLHGISREAVDRYRPGGSAHYEVFEPGYKYNLSDLQAALGRAQLAKSDRFLARRRTIAARYLEALGDVEQVALPLADTTGDLSAWYLFAIQLRLDRLNADRDAFAVRLHELGVGTSVHFKPLHLYRGWRERGAAEVPLPCAEAAAGRLLSLPIYPAMDDDAVTRVIGAVRSAAAELGR